MNSTYRLFCLFSAARLADLLATTWWFVRFQEDLECPWKWVFYLKVWKSWKIWVYFLSSHWKIMEKWNLSLKFISNISSFISIYFSTTWRNLINQNVLENWLTGPGKSWNWWKCTNRHPRYPKLVKLAPLWEWIVNMPTVFEYDFIAELELVCVERLGLTRCTCWEGKAKPVLYLLIIVIIQHGKVVQCDSRVNWATFLGTGLS